MVSEPVPRYDNKSPFLNKASALLAVVAIATPLSSTANNRQLFEIKQVLPKVTMKSEQKDVMRRRIHISESARFQLHSIPYEVEDTTQCSNPTGSKRTIDPAVDYGSGASEWWAEPYEADFINDRGEKTKSIVSKDWTADLQISESRDKIKIRANILEHGSRVKFPTRKPRYNPDQGYKGMKTVYWERFVNYVSEADSHNWRQIGFFKIGAVLRSNHSILSAANEKKI